MHPRLPHEIPELERRLHRWVREGLITEDAAGAIWSFERRSPTAAGPSRAHVRAGARRPERPVRQVPLLTEVVGYLGAALAAAAVAVFVAQTWGELAVWQRLAVPSTGLLAFLAAGSAIHRRNEPAVQRLTSLLWLLSAAAAGWLAAIVAVDVVDASDRQVLLVVGATVAVAGGALFASQRAPLLQLAIVVGLAMLLGGVFFEDGLATGIALTSLGIGWAALGWLRLLAPTQPTVVLGGLLAMWGPTAMFGDRIAAGLLLGIAVATGVVGLGALLRHGPVIGIGVAGLFLYLVAAINHFLEGRAATAIGLLVVGVALMALAVVAMRTRPRAGPPRPAHG